jgi:hypothetical protein
VEVEYIIQPAQSHTNYQEHPETYRIMQTQRHTNYKTLLQLRKKQSENRKKIICLLLCFCFKLDLKRHDMAEILLMLALNTNQSIKLD